MTPERFAKLRAALERRQPDLTVLADSVDKPRNVSAIVRTADAVGIHRIHAVAAGRAIRRYHMIAGGARRYVEVQLHGSIERAVDTLRADGWALIVAHASAHARDFRDVDYTRKVAIVAGAELRGPSAAVLERAELHVAIPMHGLGSSLNVAVATGVILFEAERQRVAAGLYGTSRLSREELERALFEWSYPDIARRCRELERPYPALDVEGMMLANPLIGVP
jgi:tRNA (guanosine-2'-O-)-methyltransferase